MPPVLRNGKGFHGAVGRESFRGSAGLRPVTARQRGGLDLATIGRQCRAMPDDSRTDKAKGLGGAPGVSGAPGASERERRLSAALRDNLRKRKAQQRERLDAQAPKARTQEAEDDDGGGDRPERD